MAEPARSDVDVRPGGVVRPLSRAATRRCSRPGCPAPATATLAFRYEDRHATLIPLATDGGPETYDLCGDHADRTNPPHGWTLEDGRPEEVAVEAPTVDTLGSERTVAVLAAALRGDAPTPEAVAVDRDHGASTDVTDVEATGDAEPAIDPAPEPTGVDVAALDAIVDQPFDEPDLFGRPGGRRALDRTVRRARRALRAVQPGAGRGPARPRRSGAVDPACPHGPRRAPRRLTPPAAAAYVPGVPQGTRRTTANRPVPVPPAGSTSR
jgi:hypothetical protein